MALFSRLNMYTVHMRPEGESLSDRITFVQEGFNLYAFIFTTLWALFNRLWGLTFMMAVANMSFIMLVELLELNMLSLMLLQLGLQFWLGFHANDFIRSKLAKRGYAMSAVVSGENKIRAEQRFFDTNAHLFHAA